MQLNISKDARRGDLRKIIGGLALAPSADDSVEDDDGSEGAND